MCYRKTRERRRSQTGRIVRLYELIERYKILHACMVKAIKSTTEQSILAVCRYFNGFLSRRAAFNVIAES